MNLPPPAADELGYNLLCRHADLWGHQEDLGLWQAWTGREADHRQFVEVVAGCRRLAKAAYPSVRVAERHFVRNHTLLPYFTAFMRQDRRIASLAEFSAAAPSVSRSLYGVFRHTTCLRFCAECAREQLRRKGFSYWARTAQLPGLSHCPWHGSPLMQTDISPKMTRSEDRLQSLDRSVKERTHRPSPRLMNRRLEARVALRSVSALRSGLGRREPVSVDHYRRALFQAGYRNKRGELRTSAFQDDFRQWLTRAGACAADFGSGAWWLRLMTRVGGSTSPLQHMLLKEFICEAAQRRELTQPDLFEASQPLSPLAQVLNSMDRLCGNEPVDLPSIPVVAAQRNLQEANWPSRASTCSIRDEPTPTIKPA